MKIIASALSFELTPAIERHVEQRLRLALGSAADQIMDVFARLSDINGARGGIDKKCQITIRLRRMHTIVVAAVDRDLYAAIDEAAARAKEAVWRHLKRRQTLRREFAVREARRQIA
jgi:putative sigma-54 modulation protein